LKELVNIIELIENECRNLQSSLINSNEQSEYFSFTNEQPALFNNDIGAIAKSFNVFEYKDGQEANETQQFYGVAAINEDTFMHVKRINQIKRELKDLYTKYNFRKFPKRREELIESVTLKRLNIRLMYRQIPLVGNDIDTLSFSYCHSKSIKSISWQEAYDKVHALGDGGQVNIDLEYLLNHQNERFAIVQKNPRHMRVNLRNNKEQVKQITAPLPVLVFTNNNQLPKILKPFTMNYLKHKREDRYLSDDPVISSIKAHKYLKTYEH
jgi:hypothetical protein